MSLKRCFYLIKCYNDTILTNLPYDEVVNLRIEDINKDRKAIYTKGGKGKKDRISVLSDKALKNL